MLCPSIIRSSFLVERPRKFPFSQYSPIRIQFQQFKLCNCYHKIKNSCSTIDLPAIKLIPIVEQAGTKRQRNEMRNLSKYTIPADTRNRPRLASATLNRSSILKEETSYGSSIHGGRGRRLQYYQWRRKICPLAQKQREFRFLWWPSPQNRTTSSPLASQPRNLLQDFLAFCRSTASVFRSHDIPGWTSLNDSTF